MTHKPAGGEQSKAGHHQKQKHVKVSDLAALAVENPVGICVLTQIDHGGGHAKGHGQADDHGVALLGGCSSQRVVGRAEREDGLVAALGGGQNGGVVEIGWGLFGGFVGVFFCCLIGEPGFNLC